MLLNEHDRIFLPGALRSNGGFHVATRWYLRGFDPLPYQWAWHHVPQLNTTLLAGIAAGKTRIATASNLIDCLSIPYFRALSTSVTARQAELGFDMFMAWFEGNKNMEHLVADIKLRPWPVIKFANFSEWEFRTAGTDARFIRGSEYDRILFDECGLDFQGEIIKVLRGRLRGTRANGHTRMARLDATTSPTDAPWLRERFFRGLKGHDGASLEEYISFRIKTDMNTNLTAAQIQAMASEYSDEMKAVEMDAEFPDYGMSMFPKGHIRACTQLAMNDMAYEATNPEDGSPSRPGWLVEEHPRHGVTKFEMPANPNHWYILAGDPGTDGPPRRNAGAVGVMDGFSGKLVYFDWVDGKGSYNPFINSFKYAIHKYHPQLRFLDTTGPQKSLQELAFENFGIETDAFNFSQNKAGSLNHLNYDITNHLMMWPLIKGLDRQLSTYTDELDRKGEPQDIVMMMAMLAYGKRFTPSEVVITSDTPAVSRKVRTTTGRKR